jgi:hypothetical protein
MKLYKGIKKRLYKKIVKGGIRFNKKEIFVIKEGDLLHDCDAFNHRVKSIEFFKSYTRRGWFLCDYEAIKDDGNAFCGCNAFPEKPHSRKEIEAYILEWDSEEMKEQREIAQKSENWEKMEMWLSVLRKGGHICNKEGVLLEEFRPEKEISEKRM